MKGARGELNLTFRCKKDGRTYLAKQYYQLPLQILPPHYQDEDGTAFVYLLNPSGGILQHDILTTKVSVEENAKVLITTPSNNKFYRMDEGFATVKNTFYVGKGGVLEYLPEHNVPFAESKSYQENEFYLHGDSVLIATDMVSSGRVAKGESFLYDLYSSKTKIYVDSKLTAYDYGVIEPTKLDLKTLGMLEQNSINATIYVYRKNLPENLVEAMRAQILENEKVRFGISKVTDSLVIVRVLGNKIVDMQECIFEIWNVARVALLGKEKVRIRKY